MKIELNKEDDGLEARIDIGDEVLVTQHGVPQYKNSDKHTDTAIHILLERAVTLIARRMDFMPADESQVHAYVLELARYITEALPHEVTSFGQLVEKELYNMSYSEKPKLLESGD